MTAPLAAVRTVWQDGPDATDRRLVKPLCYVLWWQFWAVLAILLWPWAIVWGLYGIDNPTALGIILGFVAGMVFLGFDRRYGDV